MTIQMLDRIEQIKQSHPRNLMARHFNISYYKSLSKVNKKRLLYIVKSGVENPDSSVGMYAMQSDDYEQFEPYFLHVIKDYHKINEEILHNSNWEVNSQSVRLKEVGCVDGELNLAKLGLGPTCIQIQVRRNLVSFPLLGAMDKEDRINLEKVMISAFEKLIVNKEFGGTYYSLTPKSPFHISNDDYQKLVRENIMFKDISDDRFLNSAGISSNWPYGRGFYVSQDRELIVWVGEEDHLKIIHKKITTNLNQVFEYLKTFCDLIEQYSDKFARSVKFGYVTSCPTNLGTGMHASVQLNLPIQTSEAKENRTKEICNQLGLSIIGLGGENKPTAINGTFDISASARIMVEEASIIINLYDGVKQLLVAEHDEMPNQDATFFRKTLEIPMLVPVAGIILISSIWFYILRKK